jgi:hypothetical protein
MEDRDRRCTAPRNPVHRYAPTLPPGYLTTGAGRTPAARPCRKQAGYGDNRAGACDRVLRACAPALTRASLLGTRSAYAETRQKSPADGRCNCGRMFPITGAVLAADHNAGCASGPVAETEAALSLPSMDLNNCPVLAVRYLGGHC